MFNSDCPVCYDNLINKIHFPFQCGHKVCLECNEGILDRKCPLCRSEIPIMMTRMEYLIFVVGIFCPPLLLYFLFKK
jgi:hypothetical protein